ncbi:MAG: class A beta-lactamase-related serine hydrolase [Firmicutes bacterium]|nr:class A beta-lactamase-related serine hydrolase [Bacillota bacterium]
MQKATSFRKPKPALFLWLCGLLLMPTPGSGQSAPPNPLVVVLNEKLQQKLERLAADFDGVLGVAVKDLRGGQTFLVNADTVFPQASSIKIPILIELYRQAQQGRIRLSERIELRRNQTTGGSGVLQRFGDGTSMLALRDLAMLMIVLSDNTATNILIDRLGMDRVNALLRDSGLAATRLQRRMMDADAGRASRENLSTPREMIDLLERLYRGQLLDAEHTAQVMELLSYPKPSPLRTGLPAQVPLANKPGGIPGVRCDSGLVLLESRPYAISVMTTYAVDGEAAERTMAEISRLVFNHFERLASANDYGARQR